MKALDLAGKLRLPAPREGGEESGGRQRREDRFPGSRGICWGGGQRGRDVVPDSLGPRWGSHDPQPGSSLILHVWRLGAPPQLHCSYIHRSASQALRFLPQSPPPLHLSQLADLLDCSIFNSLRLINYPIPNFTTRPIQRSSFSATVIFLLSINFL